MAKSKCKFCRTKFDSNKIVCPLCGIQKAKRDEELTKEEKKIRNICTSIRTVGALHIVFGILAIIVSPGRLSARLAAGTYHYNLLPLVFGLFSIAFGLSIRRYRRWSFYAAIVLYLIFTFDAVATIAAGLTDMWTVLSLLLVGVFLYTVANSRARKVFFRTVQAGAMRPIQEQ